MNFLVNLMFPSKCEICGMPPEPLCAKCMPVSMPRRIAGFDFPVWSMAPFDKNLQTIIRSYKDDQILALENHLVNLAKPNVELSDSDAILVVPPRNLRNYRKRGFDPALRLARKIYGPTRPILRLKLRRAVEDQRKLRRETRRQNLLEAFSANIEVGSKVILFDDVLTTGSTIREMARAVESAGGKVVGACVLAETISHF